MYPLLEPFLEKESLKVCKDWFWWEALPSPWILVRSQGKATFGASTDIAEYTKFLELSSIFWYKNSLVKIEKRSRYVEGVSYFFVEVL